MSTCPICFKEPGWGCHHSDEDMHAVVSEIEGLINEVNAGVHCEDVDCSLCRHRDVCAHFAD